MTVTHDKDTSSESCFEKSISLLGDAETANDGNESGEISDDSVVNDLEQKSVDRHRRRERAMEISVAWQDSLRNQTKPSLDRRVRRQEITEPKAYFDHSFYEFPNDHAGNVVEDRLSPREIINRTNMVLAADGRNLVTVRDEELRALVSSAVQLLYEHDQLLESRLQLAKELRGILEQEENAARSLLAEARVPNDLFSPLNSMGLHDIRSQVVPTAVDHTFKDIPTMGANDIGTSHMLSHPYAPRPNTSIPPPNLTIPPPNSSDSCLDLTVPPPPVGTMPDLSVPPPRGRGEVFSMPPPPFAAVPSMFLAPPPQICRPPPNIPRNSAMMPPPPLPPMPMCRPPSSSMPHTMVPPPGHRPVFGPRVPFGPPPVGPSTHGPKKRFHVETTERTARCGPWIDEEKTGSDENKSQSNPRDDTFPREGQEDRANWQPLPIYPLKVRKPDIGRRRGSSSNNVIELSIPDHNDRSCP